MYERLVKEPTARLGKLAAYSSEVRVSWGLAVEGSERVSAMLT